jgi:hypothetical protein
MMNGGQPIDPGLIQALQSVGSNQQDQQRLALQSQMANQMRQGAPPSNEMAGKVVVKQSPLAYINSGLRDYLSDKKQQDVMQQMSAQAQQLRDVKGKFLTALQAQQNPEQVHPDSQAAMASMPQSQTDDNMAGGNYGGSGDL